MSNAQKYKIPKVFILDVDGVLTTGQFFILCAGGDRAVAEAALHILETFFKPYNPDCLPSSQLKLSGEWMV